MIQRVVGASVVSGDRTLGRIGPGLVILVGVADGDRPEDASWLADKCADMRIFQDEEGRMNLALVDTGGRALVVSQFTLLADCRKGRRPSFTRAASPEAGRRLYELFAESLRGRGIRVETGEFGANMLVSIENEGPVTIILDSYDRSRPRRGGAPRDV